MSRITFHFFMIIDDDAQNTPQYSTSNSANA